MSTFKEQLDTGGKLLLLVAAFCYIAGVVVVNMHFSKYGFYSLDLVQINYVTAGIWALMPILFGVFTVSYTVSSFVGDRKPKAPQSEKGRPDTKRAKIVLYIKMAYRLAAVLLRSLWRIFVILIGAVFLLNGLTGYFGFNLSINWFVLAFLGIIVSVILLGLVFRLRKPKPLNTMEGFLDISLYPSIALLALLFYIALFAQLLYPEIPAVLGGGRAIQVQLVVEAASKSYLTNAGVPFKANSDISEPIGLILSTDKEYIVLPQLNGGSVGIPRESVKAVLFGR